MRLISFLFTMGLAVSMSCSKATNDRQTTIYYPEPLPDSVAIPFLPGIVSTDSVDFGAAFSPDGRSFYFARSINGQSDIYVTTHDGTKWMPAQLTPFSDANYSEADPAFAPDGKLYFISTRPKNASDTLPDYDIWYVNSVTNDKMWSSPENLTVVNSDSNEFYISFTRDKSLYFASSRAGGFGNEDIYVSRWVDDRYSTPHNIGAAINTEKSEYDPLVFPDEKTIVFTSSFREDSFGAGDLYHAKRGDDNVWLQAINLGKSFNTRSRDYCAYLTPDLKYFFYSSEKNVKWISAEALKAQIGITD
jgi:Tol biopolymer transport system component